MLLNPWTGPNRREGRKGKKLLRRCAGQSSPMAPARRGRRDAVAAAGPEHRLLGDKQRMGQKAVEKTQMDLAMNPNSQMSWRDRRGRLNRSSSRCREGESWAANGCPHCPPRPAAAARLREKGKSDHQDYLLKKSDIAPSVSRPGMSGWPYESRAQHANSLSYFAYLWSPCFSLFSYVFP